MKFEDVVTGIGLLAFGTRERMTDEQIRRQADELVEGFKELLGERTALTDAIVDVAKRLGITDGAQPLTGPQMLLLLQGMAGEVERLRKAALPASVAETLEKLGAIGEEAQLCLSGAQIYAAEAERSRARGNIKDAIYNTTLVAADALHALAILTAEASSRGPTERSSTGGDDQESA